MRCLAFMEMKNSTGLYPFLRLGMWATMMSSSAQKDGISRILVKADADKLKDVKMRGQVDEVEQLLADSWELLQSCGLEESARVGAYGRLAVRLILKLTGKEKLGKEPAGFENFQDIAKLFAAELQKTAKVKAASSSSDTASDMKVHNLIETDAAQVALLKNNHMEVGKLPLGSCFYVFISSRSHVGCALHIHKFLENAGILCVTISRPSYRDVCIHALQAKKNIWRDIGLCQSNTKQHRL